MVAFDLFCSIAQTPVNGVLPDEATMLRNFLSQAVAADDLGYHTVWVAESHFSSESQKRHREPVIPHWDGEVGLNTDICQLAPQVFARTRRIDVGSAIMNIVCNGGPLAAAERVATALSWHGLDPAESRRLRVGFSGGRFDYMNRLTGVAPRTEWERLLWPQVKAAITTEASEIFVRLLAGEEFGSDDVPEQTLRAADCRDPQTWVMAAEMAGSGGDVIPLPRRWTFEPTKIVPAHWRRELLQLVAGSHSPELQRHLNKFLPVRVFNLSFTPPEVIEATHERMRECYHPDGGPWRRDYLPRTTFVFINAQPGLSEAQRRAAAREESEAALSAYWAAMEGTVDPRKVAKAADNALVGTPDDIARQIVERFDKDDRLMLWFDLFNHDSDRIVDNMAAVVEQVAPKLRDLGVPVAAPSDA